MKKFSTPVIRFSPEHGQDITTVRDLTDRAADNWGEKIFLLSPETKRTVTFYKLKQTAVKLTRHFLGLGICKGDKISFMLDNGLFTAELLLGTMYGGFVPVPLNPSAGSSQLASTLDHSDAKLVLVSEKYLHVVRGALSGKRRQIEVISVADDHDLDWAGVDPLQRDLPIIHDEDDAILLYTSGSTGLPKGVLLSHRSVLVAASDTARSHCLASKDRSLLVLPLYHVNAQSVTLLPSLQTGGSIVIPQRFSVSQFWDWITGYQCTWSALAPSIISQLLRLTDPLAEGKGAKLAQVRFIRSSAAPLLTADHRAFEQKFGILLFEAMGSSEASGTIFCNPPTRQERKIGSLGFSQGCEVRIVDPERQELPTVEVGEIIIHGPAIMKGYYKNPELTAEILGPDGWLHTGDLGYTDQEGYLFIVGRAKDLIIKGGVNVAPGEIDEVLKSHPVILDAAVAGVPDPYFGQDIVAFVVLNRSVVWCEEEIFLFCEKKLGEFKTPAKIHIIEELPYATNGKIQRSKLTKLAEDLSANREGSDAALVNFRQLKKVESKDRYVPPSSPIEEVVAEIWSEVLEKPSVGIHDNFFELGGYSLLAIRMLCRFRERFSIEIPITCLFECPTVEQQAIIIGDHLLKRLDEGGRIQLLEKLNSLPNDEGARLAEK